MTGWKTWVGAIVIAVGAGLKAVDAMFPEYNLTMIADAILTFGAAFGLVGVAHKIEKAAK